MDKEILKILKKIHKSCEANNKVLKKILSEVSARKTHRDDENTYYNGLDSITITHDDRIDWDSTPTVYIGEEDKMRGDLQEHQVLSGQQHYNLERSPEDVGKS